MKVIIPAAGPIALGYGFPKNPKPICLYHYKGEVILERQVRILNSLELSDIRVVIGYRKELIEQFVKEKNLKIELVENPDAAKDDYAKGGWQTFLVSLRKGLEDVDDDVLIIMGDIYLTHDGLKKLLEDTHRCLSLRDNHAFNIFKIGREFVPDLRKLSGKGHNARLRDFCDEKGGATTWTGDHDIDVYRQTDEGMSWALSHLGIKKKYWNSLPLELKTKLLKLKGVKYETYYGEVLFKIEGYYGNGTNYDVYGVKFEVTK